MSKNYEGDNISGGEGSTLGGGGSSSTHRTSVTLSTSSNLLNIVNKEYGKKHKKSAPKTTIIDSRGRTIKNIN